MSNEDYKKKISLFQEMFNRMEEAELEFEEGLITSEDVISRCLEIIVQKAAAGLAPALVTPA
jgi:hypothetical protein